MPRKFLQENPRQNPPNFIQKSPTIFCRGARPKIANRRFEAIRANRSNVIKISRTKVCTGDFACPEPEFRPELWGDKLLTPEFWTRILKFTLEKFTSLSSPGKFNPEIEPKYSHCTSAVPFDRQNRGFPCTGWQLIAAPNAAKIVPQNCVHLLNLPRETPTVRQSLFQTSENHVWPIADGLKFEFGPLLELMNLIN